MEENEHNRLWIGNLDEKITDLYDDFFCSYGYQLLKLVQKYGEIEKFDLLYHRTGPLAGKSRGYGFVTFKKDADAEKALGSLHNKLFGAKRLCVKKAQSMKQEDYENFKLKPILQLPVLAGPREQVSNQNQSSKIWAIERKLQMMEKKSDLDSFLFEPAMKKPKVITSACSSKTDDFAKKK